MSQNYVHIEPDLVNAGLTFVDKNEKLLNGIVDELIKNDMR